MKSIVFICSLFVCVGFSSCDYFQTNRRLLPENEVINADSTRLAIINEFIEDEEDESFLYFQKAKTLKEIGEPEEAYKAIQKAIELDSMFSSYYFLCAELLNSNGDYSLAKEYCQRAESFGEQELELTYLSANLAAKTEDLITLVIKIAEIESVDPQYSELNYLNGVRYYLGKDTLKSIDLLSKFIKGRKDLHAYKILGELYLGTDELKKGLELDSIALSNYPNNTELLIRKANHLRSSGEDLESKLIFLNVLRLNSNNVEARLALVQIALKENNPIEGLNQLERLKSADSNKASVKSLEGDCYFMKRDYKNARLAYMDVLKQFPTDEYARKQISRINWRINNANSNIGTENNSNLAAPN